MADFDKLYKTAAELSDFSLPKYEALPEIELYMDQLTGYLNKLLCKICRSEDGTPLTANRINNYVKDGRIKRPVQKKYGKDHIAMLYMLCCTKQNLTLPEASALLGMLEGDGAEVLYGEFAALQESIVKKCAEELTSTTPDEVALRQKALELVLRSTAERFIAEAIISTLTPEPVEEKKEKPKKEKKKETAKNK